MEIEWKADDGYVNPGPQHCNVDDEDILDCETVDLAMDMIAEEIQQDFANKVNPSWDDSEVRAEVEKLFANKPKEDE